MNNMQEYTSEDFTAALLFIKAYRKMEDSPISLNKALIKSVVDKDKFDHLFNSWAGRKNDFGSFFLNLSYKTQAQFIFNFGIVVSGYQEYLDNLRVSPYAYCYVVPPLVVCKIHQLLLFFNNHGIDENSIPGLTLNQLPKKRFGNSTNWGKYILSLPMAEQLTLLKQVSLNTEDDIKSIVEDMASMKKHFLTAGEIEA
jgi:hypothetical protein